MNTISTRPPKSPVQSTEYEEDEDDLPSMLVSIIEPLWVMEAQLMSEQTLSHYDETGNAPDGSQSVVQGHGVPQLVQHIYGHNIWGLKGLSPRHSEERTVAEELAAETVQLMDIMRCAAIHHAQPVNASNAGADSGDAGSTGVSGTDVPQRTQTPLEDWVPQATSTPLPSPVSSSSLLSPVEEWRPLATSTPRPQCQ